MIYTIKTLQSLKTIKSEMRKHAAREGLDLLKEYELKRLLKDKGFHIQKEILVFELCNPPAAQEILNQLDAISVYLPYRISVYEEDGFTKLSTPKIDDLLSRSEVDEALKAFMSILFFKLKSLMHSWD